jgi:stearoyl-CoA desaturase (delta-9 desaturase)
MWLFIAFGNGTVGHRYFAHNQFSVGKKTHWLLAFWCTVSGYSSTMYWIVQHRHHHKHTDTEQDVHSPKNGILQSFIIWAFNKKRIESVFSDRLSIVNYNRCMKDHAIKFTTNNFILINLMFFSILSVIDINILYCLAIAFCLEHIRLGLINTVTHIDGFIGNYRNHDIKDHSHNNIYLGLLTLGFGWHNNHHANPNKLILTEKWWEIDLEGYLGNLLKLTKEKT